VEEYGQVGVQGIGERLPFLRPALIQVREIGIKAVQAKARSSKANSRTLALIFSRVGNESTASRKASIVMVPLLRFGDACSTAATQLSAGAGANLSESPTY
jgi:hypothetical protein